MQPPKYLSLSVRRTFVFLSILSLDLARAHQSYYGTPASRYLGSQDQNGDHLLLFELPESLSSKILDKTRDHTQPTIQQPHLAQQATPLSPFRYLTHYSSKPLQAAAQPVDQEANVALQSLVQSQQMPQRHFLEEQSISLTIPVSALQDVPAAEQSLPTDQIEPEAHRLSLYSTRQQPRQAHPMHSSSPLIGESGAGVSGGNLYAPRRLPQLAAPSHHRRPVGQGRLVEQATPVGALDYVTLAGGLNYLIDQGERSSPTRPTTTRPSDELIGQLLQHAFEQLLARRQTHQATAQVNEATRAPVQPTLWRDSFSSSQQPLPEVLSREPDVLNKSQDVSQELTGLLSKLATSSPELLIKMRNILRRASSAKNHSPNGTYVAVASLYSAAQAKLAEPLNVTEAYLQLQNQLPLSASAKSLGGELGNLLLSQQVAASRNASDEAKIVVISLPRALQTSNALAKNQTTSRSSYLNFYDNSTDSGASERNSSRWAALADDTGPLASFARAQNASAPMAPYLYAGDSQRPLPTTSAPLHTMAPYAHLFSAPAANYSAAAALQPLLPYPASSSSHRSPLDWMLQAAPHHSPPPPPLAANQSSADEPRRLIFVDAAGLAASPANSTADLELEHLSSAGGAVSQAKSAPPPPPPTRVNHLLDALSRLRPLFQPRQQQQELVGRLAPSHLMSLSPSAARADKRNARSRLQFDAPSRADSATPRMLFMIV